ncbi:proline--tRNA ligase [Paenibacillus apis]|uniref:Proline--tRNA ligase n=1 Tax=Paenibacillus apis TaxID=1792174 RepID=A0A920CMN6_9BACL|nr:proline--tRNA ligase [Paenibacillus apis]GIO44605.1 proline--tRNA ligase [Paenibacillus apis]
MLQSRLLQGTLREAPAEAETVSHQLLLRSGLVRQVAAGIYTFLPLGRKVLRKAEQIVREEMERSGAQEVLLPMMQPAELWQQSGRYGVYGQELISLSDRHGREFALGPTHEEVITSLVAQEVSSYRRLPITLFQIGTKFRDERRPRYGLLRGREFVMKDAYSFDKDLDGLDRSYQTMYEAYHRIFTRCGLRFRAVEADPGAIGGEGGTHEFMALAEIGEDTIAACNCCTYGANLELTGIAEGDRCPRCSEGTMQFFRGIELGHVFKLGTKYSEAMGAVFLDEKGVSRPVIMGCYGIGVSRLLSAVIEQHHDSDGIIWPLSLAPYQVHLIPVSVKDEQQMQLARDLYDRLRQAGADVLLDDRDERAGVKFKDSDLLGLPVRITIGKEAGQGMVEFSERSALSDRRQMNVEEAIAEAIAVLEG